MPLSKPIWLEEDERRRQIDPSAAHGEDAFFGFERIRAREKTARVLKHFDSVAAVYDGMNSLLSFGIHHAWKRASVRMLALRPGERVLDVCGGTGDLAILAARTVGRRGRVVIFDINRAMLTAGMHKVVGGPLEDCIRYVQGNAEELAFPDGRFDAAMVGFGIRNVTRMRRGFAEMHRVLRPGGRLMCLEFSRPHHAAGGRADRGLAQGLHPFAGVHPHVSAAAGAGRHAAAGRVRPGGVPRLHQRHRRGAPGGEVTTAPFIASAVQ